MAVNCIYLAGILNMPHKPKNEIRALQIHERDNVATAITQINVGETVVILFDDTQKTRLTAIESIPMAHKIALVDISEGTNISKYGTTIGMAVTDIPAGAHVHVHNIKSLRGKE